MPCSSRIVAGRGGYLVFWIADEFVLVGVELVVVVAGLVIVGTEVAIGAVVALAGIDVVVPL